MWLNSNNFDWVTKCKQNTALYQRNGSDWNGNPRYSHVKPSKLLVLYYPQLIKTGKAGECSSLSIPNVYINLPVMKANKKGLLVKKQKYTKVAIVATIRLPEDIDVEQPVTDLANPDDKAAQFKGAHLLISNRYDTPEKQLMLMQKDGRLK